MYTRGIFYAAVVSAVAGFAVLPEAHAEWAGMRVGALPDVSRVHERLDVWRTHIDQRVNRNRARIEERIEKIHRIDRPDPTPPRPDPEPEPEPTPDPDLTPDPIDPDPTDPGIDPDPDTDPNPDPGTDPTPDPDEDPDPDPDEDPEPGTAPAVTFGASELLVVAGTSVTLTWSTEDADTCQASGASGWQGTVATSGSAMVVVQATTTYALSCENDHGVTEKDATVRVFEIPNPEPEPEPEPTGHFSITEVHFNPSTEAGQGNNTDNEWIELYNGTGQAVDLMGWSIRDNTLTDILSTTSLVIPSGGYVVVTRAASTDTYWEYGTGATIIHLNNALGNGLGNTGDSLTLYTAEGAAADALSWGVIEAPVMDPPVSIVGMPAGASLERVTHSVDTDKATDWMHQPAPTPGK